MMCERLGLLVERYGSSVGLVFIAALHVLLFFVCLLWILIASLLLVPNPACAYDVMFLLPLMLLDVRCH